MAVYTRPDSPYFWLLLERPHGRKPLREPTKIPTTAPTAMQRKLLKDQAKEAYNVRMTELARADYDLPRQTTISFSAYADWWQRHHLSTRRGEDRDAVALAHLRAAFGTEDLTAIDRPRVQEYISARLAAKKSTNTINREVDVLKGLLRDAVPRYLPASPLAGMKKLRIVTAAKRIMAPEEETRLLAQLRNPVDRVFYIVAVDSLVRLQNLIDLQWHEVKPGFLDLTDSKTGPYRVALSDRAIRALASLPRKGRYVFPHRRHAKRMRDVRRAIARLLQRACARCTPPIPYGRGIGVTFHTATRATGATRMLRAGIDARTVQAIGHWKDFRAMQGYLYPDSAQMKAAVNAIAPPTVTPQSRKRRQGRKQRPSMRRSA